ncbi:MAG TPA: response regulator [Thermodesulfobacteriota bacterium]|nr:response regulator [Thermodesulfobacteriota bacterium]
MLANPRPTSAKKNMGTGGKAGDAANVAHGAPRILLVDDDPLTANTFLSALTRLGYDVTGFTNSIQALMHFQEHPDEYDLVLTDQKMPGLEGDAMAERILGVRPDIPIILCTGFTDSVTDFEARAKGIREFLIKPFSLEVLADTIRRALVNGTSAKPQEEVSH